jgi:hypothetical protein
MIGGKNTFCRFLRLEWCNNGKTGLKYSQVVLPATFSTSNDWQLSDHIYYYNNKICQFVQYFGIFVHF